MADSAQDIEKYTIDVSKLDAQIKKLQKDNIELKRAQQDLNNAYKQGKITAEQYKKANDQINAALQKNNGEVKNLVVSLSAASKEQSNFSQTIGKAFGALQGALGGIISAFDTYRKKAAEAAAAAEKAAETAALEKIKKQYEDLFNTEDEHIKEIEKLTKRTQTAGEDTAALEQQKADAIAQQLKEATLLNAQLEQQLALNKQNAEASKTRFLGGEGEQKMKAANLEVKKTEESLRQVQDRMKTLTKIQETFNEELTLKRIAAEKKASDELKAKQAKEDAEALAAYEKRLSDQANLQQTLIDKTKDLQILLIEDVNEQKISKIKLEEERQLASYDKIYATATSENKKLIDQAKNLIKETSALQIKAIKDGASVSNSEIDKQNAKIKDFIDKYSKDFMKVDPQAETEIKKLNGLLSEQAYLIETRNNKDREFLSERDKELDAIRKKYESTISKINELEASTNDQSQVDQLEQTRLVAKQEYENNRVAIVTTANQQIEQNHLETAQRLGEIEQQTAQSTLDAWSGCMSGMGDLFQALSETEDENSKKSLNLQLAAIYMNMAAGLAKGIASASEAGWPALLATIPATVAMLVGQFVQVKKLKSQAGYSVGGNVWGPGTATSDDIQARLSNGESVMTQKATSLYAPLLSALNQSVGGAPIRSAENNNTLAVQIARALSAMPNPVVSVESIERQESVVRTVELVSQL